jgi:hypothetical protein
MLPRLWDEQAGCSDESPREGYIPNASSRQITRLEGTVRHEPENIGLMHISLRHVIRSCFPDERNRFSRYVAPAYTTSE